MYLSQASRVTFTGTSLTCPTATQFVDSLGGLYGPYSFPIESPLCKDVSPASDTSVLVSMLQFSCDPCPSGSYSVFAGSSNGEARQAVNFPCLPCPSGAQCTDGGAVLALQDRWGDHDAAGIVSFVLCPAGYCGAATTSGNEFAGGPPSVHLPVGVQNACAGHRSGLLCSDCASPGYVEALGSTECAPITSCAADKAEVWPLIVLALLGSATVQLVFVSGVWATDSKPPSANIKLALYFFQVGATVWVY